MRSNLMLGVFAIVVPLVGCGPSSHSPQGGDVIASTSAFAGRKVIRSPTPTKAPTSSSVSRIQGGTVDETDNNVVSILINDDGLSLCSGSLIGPNLVLTAHHCVATPPNNLVCGQTFSSTYSADSFVVTTSYDAAANVFNSNNPQWPTVDNVTWFGVSSVAVPGTNICGDDSAALTLSASVSGICPLIPAVDTAPVDNDTYSAVGFGVTSPNGQTAGTRYRVNGMTVQCVGSSDCGDDTISATAEWEGGSNSNKGTCEGDSGGPALDSLGRVLGSTSRGPSDECNETVYEEYAGQAAWIKQVAQDAASAGGYTAAGWVTGGATSDPANGYCPDGGTSPVDAGTTTDAGSDVGGVPQNCSQADNGYGCCVGEVNYYCDTNNMLENSDCSSQGEVCGWSASEGYYDCVPPPAMSDPSDTYPIACNGPAPDAGMSEEPDAGPTQDAGGTFVVDAGTNAATPAGCNCGSGSGGESALWGLLLIGGLVHQRRSRALGG